MGVINRGFRNAFRNTIRTVSITFILGLSMAMALIMLLAMKTVQAKINEVKSSIGNTITVSPAGVRGFEGGGQLLTEQNASDIAAISHVTKVVQTLSDRLTAGTETNLASAIEPGTFGNRQRQESTGGMPIMVTGTNDIDSTASLNVDKLEIKSGQKIDASLEENIAMVGIDLASKNNLSAGSTFQAYGQDIKVAGVFDSGNRFANTSLVMPIKTVQKLSGQTDQVNTIIVQTDSIDSMSSVSEAIKQKLGDKADVVSAQDSSQNAIRPLESIKTISLYSLIGSLVAGSIIIFLVMIMIVRERRREIGVLKAIGSSNARIVGQFMSESLVLTLMGSIIGIILGFIFSNPVLKALINSSQSSQGDRAIQGGRAMMRLGGIFPGAQNALQNIHAVVSYDIIFYGILAAIIIAIIGSAIPSFLIAKIRPAEVMRTE